MKSKALATARDGTRYRLLAGGFFLVAIAAATFLAHAGSAAAAPGPAAPSAVPVSVATVRTVNVTAWDDFSGRLEAVDRVDIRPRVGGTIDQVHFREGALVKAGQALFTIDPAPYRAEVDRANAQVLSAQARLSQAKTDYERAKRLLDDHAISQREYDQASNAQIEADANLQGARAALTTAKLDLGYTDVRAPVTGRLGKIEITKGNLVSIGANAPVLTRLVSVSPIYASFDADEAVVTQALHDLQGHGDARTGIEQIPVQLGTVADTGTPIKGHLQLVDNEVDARSGTVRVRAVFDNADGALMPGQFAHLRLGRVKASPALLVSERAIGTDQDKKFLMVVDPYNKVDFRVVTLGSSVDGMRVIASGLKAGERVIVNGVQRVRPGSIVTPQEVAMSQVALAAPAASSATN